MDGAVADTFGADDTFDADADAFEAHRRAAWAFAKLALTAAIFAGLRERPP
jgi:hypothetical protein